MVRKVSDIYSGETNRTISKPKLEVNKFFVLFSIAVLGFSFFYLLYGYVNRSLVLQIYPDYDQINENYKVKIDTSVKKPNFTADLLPAFIVKSEAVASDTFDSTGEKKEEGKARGKIVIYNNYSSKPQTLVKNTRFLSADGKLFRLTERVVVPGKQNGKQGQIEAEVVADEPGPEYNIKPTTFSIPGFAGTNLYAFFYAKSLSDMSGGYVRTVKIVSSDDIKRAKNQLQNRLKESIKKSLKDKAENLGYIVFDESINFQFDDVDLKVKEGQEVEKFLWQISAKAEALAFKKSDLHAFITNKLESGVLKKAESRIFTGDFNFDIVSGDVDFKNKTALLNIAVSLKLYKPVDEDDIKRKVLLEGKEGIITLLNAYPNVRDFNIIFRPFYFQKAPTSEKNVSVVLRFD